MLTDNHGRTIDYLRLAVTDRCNLRCGYCMPAEGIDFLPRNELLSYDELRRLVAILSRVGIRKVRITGGEPFVRRGLIDFLERLSTLPHPVRLSVTTNATLIGPHIDRLQDLGIESVNVSLDALDRDRFRAITRRDQYARVYDNLTQLIERGFRVKINCIVLDGKNTDQIVPLVNFTRDRAVAVRFLEEMPFNGSGTGSATSLQWNYRTILDHIRAHFPDVSPVASPADSTSQNYRVAGHVGTVGVIPAFSRTFCGTCNRLRISARGQLRTCLYGKNELSFREALRSDTPDQAVERLLHQALGRRFADGFAAESHHSSWESMSAIGG